MALNIQSGITKEEVAPQAAAEAQFGDVLGSFNTSGRLTDLLGSYGTGRVDPMGIIDSVYSAFDTVCQSVNNKDVGVKVFKLPSNEQSADSRLAYPTILLCVTIRNSTVMTPFFIVPGRIGEFDPITIQYGQETMTVPRHPSEALDDRAIQDFKDLVKNSASGISDSVDIITQSVKCVHDVNPFMVDEELTRLNAARSLLQIPISLSATDIVINRLNGRDVSLTTSVKNVGKILNISYKNIDTPRVDEDGIPIGGGLIANVRVDSAKDDVTNSLNRRQGSYAVGSVVVRASVVHSVTSTYMSTLPNQPKPPMFTPQLILEDIHVQGDPSPANITLMLAATNPLLNADVIRRMYDVKDISYLNTRANISGDGRPFTEKDTRANYQQLWQQFFTNSIIVSICMRLGSLSSLFGSQFTRNAIRPDGVGEVKASMQALFNTAFPELNEKVCMPGIELVPVGTYRTEAGQTRPLSDIDLLWLIRFCHARPQLIDQWAMSADGSRDPLTSFAMKLAVLRVVTNGSMQVIDRGVVATFTPDYLRALSRGLQQTSVPINTNLTTLIGIEQNRWAPYMTANNALEFGSFVPYMGNNAPKGYATY